MNLLSRKVGKISEINYSYRTAGTAVYLHLSPAHSTLCEAY